MRPVYAFFVLFVLGFSTLLSAEDVAVTPAIEDGIAWYNAADWPTEGKGWTETARPFDRIPDAFAEKIPQGVRGLGKDTAGLLVRFRTDADSIRVKYTLLSGNLAMPHMPATGVSGLDLYVLEEGKWCWTACTQPTSQENTAELAGGLGREMRDYQLYLPLYNGVEALSIGVAEDAEFHAVAPMAAKPIVYYGTSITQGGCCSHPGNVYTSMLSRRLNVPFVNLGFSGSARMEPEMAEMIATLDPALFVIDAVPNMNAPLIRERALPFLETIRAAHPETPILIVDGRYYANTHIKKALAAECREQTEALREAYETFSAKNAGVYWLGHENLIGEDIDYDATMDSSHLNDLGMFRQADKLEPVIREILSL
ncbi:MAG: SGNH/GDSL hydrolase family protein [Thermoguttaceae bacterium]|nr:SGNH/GDSL hydrolase family protein [Thermoguttaceae bacterium]